MVDGMPASAEFEPLLAALVRGARDHYGPRLCGVAVYGSVARGEAGRASDVDLLVVADELPRGPMKRLKDFEAVEAVGEVEAEVAKLRRRGFRAEISPMIWSPAALGVFSYLHLDLATDARILFDPERMLETRLARVRQRMAELGTRRVPHRGTYYWVLKPGMKPWEEIDI